MDDHDDLDRLISHAPPPRPPEDIGARARQRLRMIAGVRRLSAAALGALAALVALAVLSYRLGAAVAASDAPDLVWLAMEDRTLALAVRDELVAALLDAVPWGEIAAIALSGLALYRLAVYLLRTTARLAAEPEQRR